ncbi:hypothetical protein OIU79_023191 [Salix purpurea]|uniref:Uncharacterized protein n=1 Tax=Salix purpurea TaxID=77065 RepID=A0A9Q0WI50_SALPP|nr:hypothetical protein OIU79_023191 [Salix purpurea]
MALSVSSSSTIPASGFSRSSQELKAPQRCAVKPLNAEAKRNDSIVPLAATISAPEIAEKVEVGGRL